MQLPLSFIQSIQHTKGFSEKDFLALHQSGKQVTSIRINPQKWNEQCIAENRLQAQVPWCTYGYYLKERPSFTLDPLFHGGAYYVQEASSMFLYHILQQTVIQGAGKKVLDLCAAPGGKSTLLATFFEDGLVVSNELIKSRVNVLSENLTKWGSPNTIVTNNDPKDFSALKNFFDVLVIDAPCSGSGMFRKDINAVNEWSEHNVALCSMRQQRIVEDAMDSLNEGGMLIYSTCSYSEEENEMIADFMAEKFNLTTVQVTLEAEWGVVESVSAKQNYGYRFWPDQLAGEGFFVTVFRKNKPANHDYLLHKPLVKASKPETEKLHSFYTYHPGYFLFKQGDYFRLISEEWKMFLEQLLKYLYIKKAGVEIGTIKGKDIIPSHELALSLLDTKGLPKVEVDRPTALEYLRRKDIALPCDKGWNIVVFCGLNLGWVKVLPNRINNYYPNEWRILKQ